MPVRLNFTPPLRHRERPDPGSQPSRAATGGALDHLIRRSSAPVEQTHRRGPAQSLAGGAAAPGRVVSRRSVQRGISALQGGCRYGPQRGEARSSPRHRRDRAKSSGIGLVGEAVIWQYRIKSRGFGPDEFRHRLLPGQRQGGHRDGYVNPGCLEQCPISVSLWLDGPQAYNSVKKTDMFISKT